jgi:D-3-phosphoglycerate dehydrogenase
MAQETIVITEEKIHPDAVDLLKNYRLCYTGARFTHEDLVTLVQLEQPVAILFRYGKIDARVLAASSALKVIGRHGVGMDAIDHVAAKAHGVQVLAAIGSNSQAVAELALGLMLSCARRISWLDKRMHEGFWDKQVYSGFELSGATLGVIGCGSIGSRVVRFAQAIGMNVIVCDPYVAEEALSEGVTKVELEDLLVSSDVVTLHCPLDDSTRNLLDARRLGLLRSGAIVINTARAGLFDEASMRERVLAGELYLGVDCFEQEPIDLHSPWVHVPNATLTPHIGGTTNGGLRGMAVGAAKNILSVLQRE